ncbi:hypothetical protein ALUC_10280S [Aspergillus luchuensis]|nr:hypothetical protein ALUC_10280S [Aspergillus luchuensis]
MFSRGGPAVIDPLRLGETKTPGPPHRRPPRREQLHPYRCVSISIFIVISFGAPSSSAHNYRPELETRDSRISDKLSRSLFSTTHTPSTVELSSGHHLSVYQLHHLPQPIQFLPH